MTPQEDIENRFKYHAPTEEAKLLHEGVRDSIKGVAMMVMEMLPECREKSLALTKLEEAMLWANAAIARNHSRLPTMKELLAKMLALATHEYLEAGIEFNDELRKKVQES